jgi:hypothetical protein
MPKKKVIAARNLEDCLPLKTEKAKKKIKKKNFDFLLSFF